MSARSVIPSIKWRRSIRVCFFTFFFSCWFSFLFSVDLIGLSPAAGEGLRSKRRETNQWPTGVFFFFSFFFALFDPHRQCRLVSSIGFP